MEERSVREPVKAAVDYTFTKLTMMLAVIMIFYSLVGAWYDYDSHEYYSIFIFGFPIAFSILILLDRHRSVFFAVGMFAIAIGLSRAVRYHLLVQSEGGMFDSIEHIVGWIMIILALNMIFSGYKYLSGNSRSIYTILFTACMFALLLCVNIYIELGLFGPEYSDMKYVGYEVATLIMYLLYIGLVWSEPVRQSTSVERMRNTLAGYRVSEGAGPVVYVRPLAARELIDFVRNGDAGTEGVENPVHGQITVEMNDKLRTFYCTLQRWYGEDGPVYISMTDHIEGSMLNPRVRQVKDIVEREGFFYIRYADDRIGKFIIFDYANRAVIGPNAVQEVDFDD